MPWPVFVLGDAGRVVLGANAASWRLYGYRSTDLAGVPSEVLFHRPEDHARLLDRVEWLREGEEGVDVVLSTRGREPAPARSWLVRAVDGRVLLLVVDRRDLAAAQRRTEELLVQLVAQEQRVEAVASGTLTHALSQPLMAAMGNLELLLLSGEAPPEIAPRLERAYEQLDRVRRILTGPPRREP